VTFGGEKFIEKCHQMSQHNLIRHVFIKMIIQIISDTLGGAGGRQCHQIIQEGGRAGVNLSAIF